MKRIVFSTFSDINVGERVTNYSKSQFTKYYDKLLDNKKQYAESCSADFELLSPDIGYVEMQHYKIQAAEKLADQYDQILYLDFDVVIKTQVNIFDQFDMDKISLLMEDSSEIVQRESARVLNKSAVVTVDHYKEFCTNEMFSLNKRDDYHRLSKANTKRMMLFEDDVISKSYMIANTGIILTGKQAIQDLGYSAKLDHMKSISHFNNNEVFITYLLEQNQIPYNNLGRDWHRVYDDLDTNVNNAYMVHAINKRFEDLL